MLKVQNRNEPGYEEEWVVIDFDTRIIKSRHLTKEAAEKAAGIVKPKKVTKKKTK